MSKTIRITFINESFIDLGGATEQNIEAVKAWFDNNIPEQVFVAMLHDDTQEVRMLRKDVLTVSIMNKI